jgi:hypothetical protein
MAEGNFAKYGFAPTPRDQAEIADTKTKRYPWEAEDI